MKYLRIAVTALFVVVVCFWGITTILDYVKNDHVCPVIQSDIEVLELSVKDDPEVLLTGLTATDDKDGDLTEQIMVGTHSKFISPGVCDITYLVFDTSNNVGEFTRRTKYTDYEPPVLKLNQPLMYTSEDTVSILPRLSLKDSLDGDISSKLKIVVNNIDPATVGTYSVTIQAANSYADVITQKLLVNIVNDTDDSPKICLNKYLIYADVGEKIDPKKYILSVEDKTEENVDLSKVKHTAKVDTKKPGVHQVTYQYTDARGLTGHTFLTVIVREK